MNVKVNEVHAEPQIDSKTMDANEVSVEFLDDSAVSNDEGSRKKAKRRRKLTKTADIRTTNSYKRPNSSETKPKNDEKTSFARKVPRNVLKIHVDKWQENLTESGFIPCSIGACRKRYQSIPGMKTHYQWCTGESENETSFRCEVCSFEFGRMRLLKRHQTMAHKVRIDNDDPKPDNAVDVCPSADPLPSASVESSNDDGGKPKRRGRKSKMTVVNGNVNGVLEDKDPHSAGASIDKSESVVALVSDRNGTNIVKNEEQNSGSVVKRRVGRPPKKKPPQSSDTNLEVGSTTDYIAGDGSKKPIGGVRGKRVSNDSKNDDVLQNESAGGLNSVSSHDEPLKGPKRKRVSSPSDLIENNLSSRESKGLEPVSFNSNPVNSARSIRSLNRASESSASLSLPSANENKNEEPSLTTVTKKKRGRPKRIQPQMNGTPASNEESESIMATDSTRSESEVVPPLAKKRGRRPKNSVAVKKLEPGYEVILKCGVCALEIKGRSKFELHANTKHNGLARPEGEDQTFTTAEKNSLLRRALLKLGRVRCFSEGCTKTFTTSPGYIYHEKVCGKDVCDRMVGCEICGKMLIKASMSSHVKALHPPTPPPKSREQSEDESSIESAMKGKRIAARKASKRVSQIAKDMQKDNFASEGRRRSKDDDDDFNCDKDDSEEDEDDENDGDEELDDDADAVRSGTKGTGDTGLEELYHKPSPIFITKETFTIWREELDRDGVIRCRTEGCSFTADTMNKIVYHQRNCGAKYTCIVCHYVASYKRTMMQHVRAHRHKHENQTNTNSTYRINVQDENFNKWSRSKGSVLSRMHDAIKNGVYGQKFFTAHVEFATEFFRSNYTDAVFPAWRTREDRWRLLSESEYLAHLPSCKESGRFRSDCSAARKAIEEEDRTCETLQLFESKVHGLSKSGPMSCFVGGPVWACAWCPTPHHLENCTQYVAVACHGDMNLTHTCCKKRVGPGLIQIWNVGDLEEVSERDGGDDSSVVAPRLVLSICHDYGTVWSLVWCPSGCWDCPNSEGIPRLGLLAAAFSDGSVRIYSVPHPTHVNGTESPQFYAVTPTAVLSLKGFELEDVQCTALSWLQHKGHDLLAAGYTNGIVGVYDLSTTSPLLRTKVNGTEHFTSFHTFLAHGIVVTGLDFAHSQSGTHLVSVGGDRQIKFWDLRDTSIPYNVVKQFNMSGVRWMPHWCGVIAPSCNAITTKCSGAYYIECGYYGEVVGVFSYHNATVWDVSPSYWMNSVVSCDAAGEVVVCFLGHLMQANVGLREVNFRHLPLFRVENEKRELNGVSDAKPTTYEESVARYNTLYKDQALWDLNAIPLDDLKHTTVAADMNSCPIEEFNLNSVNRVAWNPNLGSHRWIVSGGQNGFLRFVCMKGMDVVPVNKVRDNLRKGSKENDS